MCSILVAVPAAGFLLPLFLLLLIQAKSVSAAERSYEGKVRGTRAGRYYTRLWVVMMRLGYLGTLRPFSTTPVLGGLNSLEGASLALPDPGSAQISSPS